MTGRDEVPAALDLPEVEMAGEDALASVQRPARVLDVHVVDPVGELLDERRGIEELMREVARVEVEAELRPPVDRSEGLARRDEVVRDLRRVNLQAEADALGSEDVHDRPPAFGEVLVAPLDLVEVVRRERVQQVPDARAGEAVDLLDAEQCRSASRVLQPLRCALEHTFGLAVPPHFGGQNRPMPLIDRIADTLTDEVRADRMDLQPVPLEDVAPRVDVPRIGKRLVDLEMIAPAGQLEAVEAPRTRFRSELLDRQVGPLAGEERNRPRHQAAANTGTARPGAPSSEVAGS